MKRSPRKMMDWPLILQDVRRTGLTFAQQAIILGVATNTLHKWRQGHQPYWSSGNAILSMHRAACGDDLADKRYEEAPEIEETRKLVDQPINPPVILCHE